MSMLLKQIGVCLILMNSRAKTPLEYLKEENIAKVIGSCTLTAFQYN